MHNQRIVEWILRIGLFGEFFGHGIFAWQAKPRFIEMLTAMTGIAGDAAATLIRVIGVSDILIALFALVRPIRIVLIFAALWALGTAIARPIAGDPIWDFVERWANWAVPLALLYVRGLPKNWKELFT